METKTQEYNGWSNYETWLVNLWLTNERETNDKLRSIALFLRTDDEYLIERADKLQEWVEDLVLKDEANLRGDLLRGALSSVNWLEIIRSVEE